MIRNWCQVDGVQAIPTLYSGWAARGFAQEAFRNILGCVVYLRLVVRKGF